MEGWLQVPPERNLIGRAGWKPRYIRFSNVLPIAPTAQRASISTVSPARPTTSGSSSSAVGTLMNSTLGKRTPGLERSHSTHQVSSLASAAMAATDGSRVWTLAIYKQKTDTEPVAKYSIQKIASCYVGDVASHKKRSLVQPTLVINLRNDPPPISSTYTSSRSFRRRSSEAPPNGFRKEGSGNTTLLFRLSPELSASTLERWSREIQTQLVPISLPKSSTVGVESAFRETFQEECDYDTPAPSPSSLFLVNGEPNTALLSPSIRSRTSNLSSIDSEDKISYSSSYAASEMIGSPGMDDRRPQSSISDHQQHQRPALHVRTNSRKGSDTMSISNSSDIGMRTQPQKRETILDRFFATAPSSPSSDVVQKGKPISSIARFEALMNDLESKQEGNRIIEHQASAFDEIPKRIPSPTQRALEFVSTGYRGGGAGSSSASEETPSPKYETATTSTTANSGPVVTTLFAATPRTSAERFSATPRSRRNSDTLSLDTMQSSYTASTGGTASMVMMESSGVGSTVANILGPASQSKRHSVAADFSMMRIPTVTPPPPLNGQFRRNSFDDMASIGEEAAIDPGVRVGRLGMDAGVMESGEFGAHHIRAAAAHEAGGSTTGRPLFREFSF